ncbi:MULTISPECIES: ABC transporter substrate-binding protein [unclassified Neptuniibacter]|jgi:polar amino acid transport system substrate-binding protein|uniref:substrate-binding periplasmic protein n=1 Tax=unclassified Neptuniibacter TaxID=2630693 RepID=UPI0026E33B7F|nr:MULTISPECIES: transporter substrate-binding domain-containing protein [unclassified Neptuniibacter]MDO6515383.1 transporter substrate-binding domain-containing protein [Neptuniibacter sp. 2_MG-2023]MDO6594709.1 transporter substrate-binding domain-containing protein [Neptuniibacter sp. 1_MG-2023]
MFTTIKKLTVLSCFVLSPLASAGTIEQILEKGELHLCAHPAQMPFSARAEKPKGFQIDVAKAIAKKLDVALNVSWIMPRRQAKKVGCDLYSGVARLGDGDSKYMLISDPYLRLEFKLVTLKNKPTIKNLDDLGAMVVGVSSGSIASHALSSKQIGIAVRFADEASRLQALADGLIDAAVVSNVSSGWFQRQHGLQLVEVDAEKILNAQLNYDYALGLRKADQNTRAAFNQTLVDLKKDGTLGELLNEYGVSSL